MSVTDFHIMDRKISIDIDKENHNANLLVCSMLYLFLNFVKILVFINDITNKRISQNIEKIHSWRY